MVDKNMLQKFLLLHFITSPKTPLLSAFAKTFNLYKYFAEKNLKRLRELHIESVHVLVYYGSGPAY